MLRRLFLLLCLTGGINAYAQSEYDRGRACQERGDYQEAIDWYKKAEPKSRNLTLKTRLWQSLVACYKNTGDYGRAIHYNDSLLRVLTGEQHDKVLLNQSGLWLLTGQTRKIIDRLAGLHCREGEDIRIVNLSSAYAREGENRKAIALLDSVMLVSSGASDATRVTALQNKGYILWNMKEYAAAKQAIGDACAMYAEQDANRYICMGNLAVVEAELQQFEEALGHISQVLDWQRQQLGETHPDYAVSLRKKAEILLKMGNVDEAVRLFKAYFEQEKRYILSNFTFMTEDERLNFWHSHSSLLAECYATEATDPDFLFDVALFSKSVLLQAARDFRKLASEDAGLSAQYEALRTLRSRLQKTQGSERVALESEAEQQERRLMASMGTLKSYVEDLSIGRREVARALKSRNDRVIEFIQYNRNDTLRYAALVLAKDAPVRFVPLFTQAEVDNRLVQGKRLFGTVKEAVYSRKDADKNRLYADTLLGRQIWAPLLEAVPTGATVYFVPDGLFHLLAIEYLCFDRPDCKLYRLSSSRRLCEKRRGKVGSSMLLVGGVDYDDASASVEHRDTVPDRRGSEVLLLDGMPPVVGGGYGYLAGSSAEVDSIASLLGREGHQLVKKAHATEELLKREMEQHDRLHLSTHGFCSDYRVVPLLSHAKDSISEDLSLLRCGLLLSGANRCALQEPRNAYLEDGILTARELCDLNLGNVDLAVLSACQTGLGRVTEDGVAGLPRGLKKAGVNSVVVSLWEVNDRATQILMSCFYRFLGQKNVTKQEALRRAQEALRRWEETQTVKQSAFSPASLTTVQRTASLRSDYDKPCFWAAFVLIDGID